MNLLQLGFRAAGRALSPAGKRARLSILMYHRVRPAPDPLTGDVDAATFDALMQSLVACFNVLPLSEAVQRLSEGSLPPRAACVTFDDGYRDNLDIALPILQRHRVPATFFIATGFLDGGRMFNDSIIEIVRRMPGSTLDARALGLGSLPLGDIAQRRAAVDRLLDHAKYLQPQQREACVDALATQVDSPLPDDLMLRSDQLAALAAPGMEIGAHTVNHPILAKIDLAVAREEIAANKATLEALLGRRVALFAYPNGVPDQDYRAEHVALVRSLGFDAAVSTAWGAAGRGADRFQLPRFTPWDSDPRRFVARLLHNAWARRDGYAVAGATALRANGDLAHQ